MAIQTLNTIKNWFKTSLKPTQQQFWDTWDSFRHKFEKVPMKDVENLETALDEKAEKLELNNHTSNTNAHTELFSAKEDKSQKGISGGYAPLDEFSKITSQYLNIVNNLITNSETSLLSAQQGVVLQNQINQIKNLLESDNINLDTIQKIADTIEEIQLSLNNFLINDLTTGGITKALSAEMGKLLQSNKEEKSQKGIAGGYASLDNNSLLPKSQSQGSILSYNSTDGIVTLTDARGEMHSIDLPIQNLFQNASYDNSTQDLTLTTNGGGTIVINLSTLVDLPEIVLADTNPVTLPTTGQKLYFRLDNGNYWINQNGNWSENFLPVSQSEKDTWNSNAAVVDVSETVSGIVNNTDLQELGGVDKLINNIRIGRGNSNNTASTVFGRQALTYATGTRNAAFGTQALRDNTTGTSNVAMGIVPMAFNTTGSYNVGIGDNVLYDNTTGSRNIAVGYSALSDNISGSKNIGIGYWSMRMNTTGEDNTALGYYSLSNNISAFRNTAIGNYASSRNTIGEDNTSLGYASLYSNQFGHKNTSVGAFSMYNTIGTAGSDTYGHRSTAVGYYSMFANTVGNGTALGSLTLYSQTTGTGNIAVGDQAGINITTGSRNVILAGTGFSAGGGLTTGNDNLIVAPNNGQTTGITTGSGNVILGKMAVGLPADLQGNVILANGIGEIALRKNTNNELLAPTLTNALITSGGNKSLITKEYIDSKIGVSAPTSSTDAGTPGDIRVSGGYIYWYVSGTGWLRTAGSTF